MSQNQSLEQLVGSKLRETFDQVDMHFFDDVYRRIIGHCEAATLKYVLARVHNNQVRAAKILGVNRNTLRKKMKAHGLLEASCQSPSPSSSDLTAVAPQSLSTGRTTSSAWPPS